MAKRQQLNNVKTLQNDYFHTTDSQAKILRKQKVLFKRRMAVFIIFAAIVFTALTSTLLSQNKRLSEKEQQKEEVLNQLETAKEQQESLKLQISKLQDDDYIAKLARKELFLSEEGEIIFTIPDDDKDKENENEND